MQHHTRSFLRAAAFAGLCILSAFPAMAQSFDENDNYHGRYENFDPRSLPQQKKSYTVIRAGMNISSTTNIGSSGLGYDASVGFIFPMKYVYFMPEFGLSSRRCDYADLVDFDHHPAVGDFRQVHFDAISHNIKVRPVQFGTTIGGGTVAFDIHAGCFASYDFAHKTVVDEWSSYKPEYDTLPEQNSLDYGINVGAGMFIGRVNLDFTYERGFADFFETRSSKTNQCVVRLGVMF